MKIVDNNFLFKKEFGFANGCTDSDKTANVVEECPQTLQAWRVAAARKNCGGILHSCFSFVYHCIMNTWQNETFEVCARQRVIVGKNYCKTQSNYQVQHLTFAHFKILIHMNSFYAGKNCAEYNFLGNRVQRNEKVHCRQCPDVYNSTDSYLCKTACHIDFAFFPKLFFLILNKLLLLM